MIFLDSVNKAFASNIKNLRKQNKLTQVQLANKLEVDNTTVSKWESGIYEPNSEMLSRLATLFDTTVDNILGLNNNGQVSRDIRKGENTKDFHFYDADGVQFIARSDKNLSPEAFRKMQELAKKAAELFDEEEDE